MRRRTAKEHGETSCVEELKKSEGFMKEMRQKYAALVELARKGEKCEGRMIVRGDGGGGRGVLHSAGALASRRSREGCRIVCSMQGYPFYVTWEFHP